MKDSLLLIVNKKVCIPNILSLMVKPLDPTERRAHRVKSLEKTELAEKTETRGEEDEVRTGVDNNARAALEKNKIDTSPPEGVGCCEADGTAANDDDFEVGAHLDVIGGDWLCLIG